MTALTISAALAIATQCSPGVDAHTMVGIAQRESGYGTSIETQILHDNTTHHTEVGTNVIAAARSLIAAGHSVDLGPWQINNRNLGLLGISLQDAFDPCQSVAGAARLLQLLSAYNTGSPSRGIVNGYAGGVAAAIRGVKDEPALAAPKSDAPVQLTLQDQLFAFHHKE
jgi:type IV secretion system protein VirB1